MTDRVAMGWVLTRAQTQYEKSMLSVHSAAGLDPRSSVADPGIPVTPTSADMYGSTTVTEYADNTETK